jgi:DNA replication protein DnaC
MTRIKQVTKKIGENMSRENMATSSSINRKDTNFSADPNCPQCGGVGYVRLDLPASDPNFGKLQICTCLQKHDDKSAIERLYHLSNLQAFKEMTFENFSPKGRMGLADQQVNSLSLAFNQAQQYARDLKGWALLMGGYGCGKTHLAAAIANHAVSYGVPTLFLTVPDLLDWLRFSYDSTETSFEDRFEEIRNIRLLVLDDLGTQNATPWAEEKLYQIINHRYTNKLSTVLTTNLELMELDGRIRSRLQDPDLVAQIRIAAPDYRSPVRDLGQSNISTLSLVSDHTFGNFSLRENEKLPPEEQKSLEKAFRAAQQFAELPKGWLMLQGTYGCGKTHLAAAIGNYRAAEGDEPIFIVVPDLLDHLRSTFGPNSNISYDHLFEQVRSCKLLVLDDLGTQSATPWAKEKLFQLLNFRYEALLPTVITTSSSLEEIDARIRSRMMDTRRCTIYAILAPTYRGGSTRTSKKTLNK